MNHFLLHRPIAVLIVSLAFLILGIVTAFLLPVSLMPEVDIPEIAVQLNYTDRTAQEIEDLVVRPMRLRLQQIASLDDLKSETRDGQALIRLRFAYGTQMDYAFLEVNEKIDAAMPALPRDLERPRIIKSSAADLPVFYLAVSYRDPALGEDPARFMELSEYVEEVMRRRLEQLPEVALADISGKLSPEVQIVPDLKKMSGLGLQGESIKEALQKSNAEIGNLLVREGAYQYNVRFASSLRRPEDLADIYLKANGRLHRLGDLAKISWAPQAVQGLCTNGNRRALLLALIKQSDTRMENMKVAVDTVIRQLLRDQPELQIEYSQDQSALLNYSIENLKQNLLAGGLLAFVLMFFFLRDTKSPFLIGLSIPMALVLSLLMFYVLGLSINVISLAGLLLGIGLMIDNSIVVIDNIAQYREAGYELSDACVKGTREVVRPLLSSALTTVSVFVPLIFLSGISGALFYDQAMAITIGQFASFLVGVFLLPVAYRLLYLRENEGYLARLIQRLSLDRIGEVYERSFRAVFKWRWLTLFSGFLFVGASVLLWRVLPLEQFPALKQTELLLHIDWNERIHPDENRRRIDGLLLESSGFVDQSIVQVGLQQFALAQKRELSPEEALLYLDAGTNERYLRLEAGLKALLRERYPAAKAEFEAPPNLFQQVFGATEAPWVLQVSATNSQQAPEMEALGVFLDTLNQKLSLNLSPVPTQEYIAVQVDPYKLLLYEVEADVLYERLRTALQARQLETLRTQRKLVPIMLKDPPSDIWEILSQTFVINTQKKEIPISALLQTETRRTYKQLTGGRNGLYVPLSLEENPGLTESTLRKWAQQAGLELKFSGSRYSNRKLLLELSRILAISLLLMYFILAAQFESLLQPLIVLIEIPIDISAALLMLYLFGASINLMSMIGMIVMGGVIINDSILKIDTINQLRAEGHNLLEAIEIGGKRRLKAILMTGLVTILTAAPFFVGGDDLGTALQKPLALTLLGGMTVGTLVSLYYIPIAYWFIYRKKT